MKFKTIAATVAAIVMTGAPVGAASATSKAHTTTSGTEQFWAGSFSPTTLTPTVFVGSGLFTDAGSISSNGTAKLSKGTLLLNFNKITVTPTHDVTTCFASVVLGGSISFGSGTGAYKGISGTFPVSGRFVEVVSRLTDGKCDTASNAVPLGVAGEFSGSGKVTLGN
jgi:hypothetical protein